MKKRLSFALVAIMLLSTLTFTGCSMDDVFRVMDLLTPTNPTASAKTTITKEEWTAAMDSTNFTLDATDGEYEMFGKLTDSIMYQSITEIASNTVKSAYLAIIENVPYYIAKTEDGYVAYSQSSYTAMKFSDAILSMSEVSDLNVIYDALVYNEAHKSYHYENENCTLDISFENGKIESAHAVLLSENPQVVYEFYDFGTTVVDLPEFTYATAASQ